jgi:hypothetical protein
MIDELLQLRVVHGPSVGGGAGAALTHG